jgi:hypothetical protein
VHTPSEPPGKGRVADKVQGRKRIAGLIGVVLHTGRQAAAGGWPCEARSSRRTCPSSPTVRSWCGASVDRLDLEGPMADADCHTGVRLRLDDGRVNSREPREFGGGCTPRRVGCPPHVPAGLVPERPRLARTGALALGGVRGRYPTDSGKCHIPSDFVVDQWASAVESSSSLISCCYTTLRQVSSPDESSK